jgi:hypothetical protein
MTATVASGRVCVEEAARATRAAAAIEGAVASWTNVLTAADAVLQASGHGALDSLLAVSGLTMGDVARLLHVASSGLAVEIEWQQPFSFSNPQPAAIVSELTIAGCRIPHLLLNQVKLCLHHPTTRNLVFSADLHGCIETEGAIQLQGARVTSYAGANRDAAGEVVWLELCESPLTFVPARAPASVPPKPATSRLVVNFDEDEVREFFS